MNLALLQQKTAIAAKIRRLAIELLQQMEQVYEVLGYTIPIGIEREFFMTGPTDLVGMKAIANSIGREFHLSNANIRGNLKTSVGIRPGNLGRIYNEQDLHLYEVTTKPLSPLRAAHLTDGIERFFTTTRYQPKFASRLNDSLSRAYFTSAMDFDCTIGAALQVSASLWKGENNLFADCAVRDLFTVFCQQLGKGDTLLVADDSSFFRRIMSNRAANTCGPRYAHEIMRSKKDRTEFRLPGASSDPYVATLLIVVAFASLIKYSREFSGADCLEGNNIHALEDNITKLGSGQKDLPTNPEAAIQQFREAGVFMKWLREISKNLLNDRLTPQIDEFDSLQTKKAQLIIELDEKIPSYNKLPNDIMAANYKY